MTILSILFGSFLFWGVMGILMIKYNTTIEGERRETVGTKIVFGIKVMKADGRLPQEASQDLEDAILEHNRMGQNEG